MPEAWLCVLRHVEPMELKDFLAPDEEAKWRRVIETEMGAAKEHDVLPEKAESLLAEVLAESRTTTANANLRRWLRLIEE